MTYALGMWLARALLLGAIFLSVSGTAQEPAAGTIRVDASKPGHPISPGMYGIFFEEISHAGDGGLYAEMVQYRSFEDNEADTWERTISIFFAPDRWFSSAPLRGM